MYTENPWIELIDSNTWFQDRHKRWHMYYVSSQYCWLITDKDEHFGAIFPIFQKEKGLPK